MMKRSRVITMSPLVVNQEDDLELDLDLWEVVNPSDGEYSDDSFSVVSLSDDEVISLDDAISLKDTKSVDDAVSLDNTSFVSPSVLPPTPQILPGDDGGDLAAAADLDLGDHVGGNGDADHVDGNDDADHFDGNGDADHVSHDEIDDNDLGWDQQRIMFLDSISRYPVGVAYGNYVDDESDEDRGVEDDDYDDSYDLNDELVLRNVRRKVGRERIRKLGNRGIAKVSTSKKSPYSYLKPGCVRGKHGLGMKLSY